MKIVHMKSFEPHIKETTRIVHIPLLCHMYITKIVLNMFFVVYIKIVRIEFLEYVAALNSNFDQLVSPTTQYQDFDFGMTMTIQVQDGSSR